MTIPELRDRFSVEKSGIEPANGSPLRKLLNKKTPTFLSGLPWCGPGSNRRDFQSFSWYYRDYRTKKLLKQKNPDISDPGLPWCGPGSNRRDFQSFSRYHRITARNKTPTRVVVWAGIEPANFQSFPVHRDYRTKTPKQKNPDISDPGLPWCGPGSNRRHRIFSHFPDTTGITAPKIS